MYYLLSFSMLLSIAHMSANTTSAINLNANQTDQTETIQANTIDAPNQEEQEEQKARNETIEELTKLLLKALTKIEFAVETVATYIRSGDVKIEDKHTALDNILKFRQVVSSISRDVMMCHDIMKLTCVLKITSALQKHVAKAVNNNLKEFPLFDVHTIQLKSIVEMYPNEIKNELKALRSDLEKITKNAENAGISPFNKVCRSIDSWTIEPIEKYGLDTAAFWTLAIAATATYVWFHASKDASGCTNLKDYTCKNGVNTISKGASLGSEINENVSLSWENRWDILSNLYLRSNKIIRQGSDLTIPFTDIKLWHGLGRPSFDSIKQADISDEFLAIQTGKLAALDNFIFSEKGGYLSVGSLFLFPKINSLYQNYLSPKINLIHKKAGDFRAYCKGGIYYKQRKNISEKAFSMNPRFRFKDVIGNKEAIETGMEFVKFALDSEKFLRTNINPDKGIILTGEPGTGKTHFAEAMAGEIQYWLKKE